MVLDIHNIPSMFEVLRLEEKMLDLNLNDINYNIFFDKIFNKKQKHPIFAL